MRIWTIWIALCAFLWSPLASAQDAEENQPPPEGDVEADTKDGKKPDADKGDRTDKGEKAAKRKAKDAPPANVPLSDKEQNCGDRIDNDGDSVIDCADADCEHAAECKQGGQREQTNQLCSDFIDNDADGKIDCEDLDCQSAGVTACRGSYKGEVPGVQGRKGQHFALPPLDEGMSVDQLIGKLGDKDGERNDYACSDGIDNDGDGKTDCADYGCRFDPQVTICNPQPGFRFSVVAQIQQLYRIKDTNPVHANLNSWDTNFSLLQLRFLGPIANIENSFFLINLRAEKTPRLTFAMFQLPIGKLGHYVNVNSGGGGLTAQLIISASKHLLLEPAFFVYSAFEQGNGAAIEFGGPIDRGGRVNFRVFGAGGAGTFSGNVGGRFFSDANANYAWSAGAQFQFNAIGFHNRFDSPYLYNPSPLKLAFLVGGKYDQRSLERYPAWNGIGVLQWWHFYLMAETYWKRELEFKSWQYSYLVTLGALLWPRHLFIATDFGEYIAGDLEAPPENISAPVFADIKKQQDERQFRAALHWYAYETTGLVSFRYKFNEVKNSRYSADGYLSHEIALYATYRF
jgi:hypothetical protein